MRVVLRTGDQKMVCQTVEKMRPNLRGRDPAWTCQYGRVLKADSHSDEARQQFQSIAGRFSFYGQSAQEELGQHTTVPSRTTVADVEIDIMGHNHPGFGYAKKLYNLNLRFEDNHE